MDEEVAYIKEKMSEGSQPEEERSNGIQKKPNLFQSRIREIKFDVFDKVRIKSRRSHGM